MRSLKAFCPRRAAVKMPALLAAALLVSCSPAEAEDPLEQELAGILRSAGEAAAAGEIALSDFHAARYMGLTVYNPETERDYEDLIPLFRAREDLQPVSLLPGHYDESFYEFFVFGPAAMWGVPSGFVDKENREFVVRSFSDGSFFAGVAAVPRLESWHILRYEDTGAVIPLGANPAVRAGRIAEDGKPVRFERVDLPADGRPLHYVWTPEFHDLDGGGVPEIWVRYILTTATGFSQELAIYRIEGDGLALLKRFSGKNEGLARRLEDGRVEVGEGYSEEPVGRMGYDRTRLETREYREGEFVKTSERSVPHILRSPDWKEYYF